MLLSITAGTDFSAFAGNLASSGEFGYGESYTYDYKTGRLVINGTGDMMNYSDNNSPFYNSNIKTVLIEEGITSVADYLFEDCRGLISVELPNSIEKIGDCAFWWCTGLKTISLPEGLKSIGDSAFRSCTGLNSVFIPESVNSIGYASFYECKGLTNIVLPESIESIEEWAFGYCISLTSISLPKGITSILDYTFCECKNLKSISFPSNLTSIEEGAFYNCMSLAKLIIPDSVTFIGDEAMSYCSGLTTFSVGNSVTRLGNYVFKGCTGLTNITLPAELSSIGKYVFLECIGLKNISVDTKNIVFSSLDGVMYDKNKTVLIQYPANNSRTIYRIPDSVKTINDDAFSYCKNLSEIYYNGSKTQWENISIYFEYYYLDDATIYCSDGVINQKNNKPVKETTVDLITKPAQVKSIKLKSGKKSFTVTWKKVKGAKGYQIQYSLNKKFKKGKTYGTKTITVKKAKTVKKLIKKLKKNKKYFVRVRAYKLNGKKKVTGKWSKVKTVKTK